MSLADIRVRLIDNWPCPAVLQDNEQVAFREQLGELRRSHEASLWKTICLLAGQVIEALLRKRLQLLQPPPILDRAMGLGQLIKLAYARSVLLSQPAEFSTSTASLAAARILRNWSAHYSLTSRSTNELRATQAIALAYSATTCLFSPVYNDQGEYDDKSFLFLQELFVTSMDLDLRNAVQAQLPTLARSAATLPLSRFVRAISVLRKRQVNDQVLADGITEHFQVVIARVAVTNVMTLQKVVSLLLGLGMREHGRVVSALLPVDASVLCELGSRKSPAWLAMYVQFAYRSDPDLFRAKCAQNMPDERAVDMFWAGLANRNAGILNTVQILRRLPIRARAAIMLRAPIELLVTWIRSSSALGAVKMTQLFRQHDVQLIPSLRTARRRIFTELIELVSRGELQALARIPDFLRGANVVNEDLGVAILNAILQKVSALKTLTSIDMPYVRRALWEIYAFCDSLAAAALAQAKIAIHCSPPCWDAACLLGMLWSGFDIPVAAARTTLVGDWLAALQPPSEVGLWEPYLAFLGARCALGLVQHELPASLTDRIALNKLPANVYPRPRKLYDRVIALSGQPA